ncbi:MAG: CARDB domain-containing protein [Myxococcota bacterium]|jgi:hypothetical protein|nr:CARDB domain-containing protein [Myxococcota bacterium]
MKTTRTPRTGEAGWPRFWSVGVLSLGLAALTGGGCDEDEGGESLRAVVQASPVEGAAPLDVEFLLVVTGAGPEDELACEWDYGDGSTSAGCSVRHLYAVAAAEPYVVRAGVRNLTRGEQAAAEPITIRVRQRAELTVSRVAAAPRELEAGQSLRVSFQVTNAGGTELPATVACVQLLLDEGQAVPLELGQVPVPPLPAGESQGFVELPFATRSGMRGGYYRVQVLGDCTGQVTEANEEDNLAEDGERVLLRAVSEGPDLLVRNFAASPTTVLVGVGGREPLLEVGLTLANDGNLRAGPFSWSVLLTTADTPDPARDLTLLHGALDGLDRDREQRVQQTVTLPDELLEGSYRLFAVVDPADEVPGEIDEFNNQTALDRPLQLLVGAVEGYDLLPVAISTMNTQVPIGGSIDVQFSLCNRGTLAVPGNFFATLVLSEDDRFDPEGDPRVGNVNLSGLGAASCVDARLTKLLPPSLTIGPYRLAVIVDPSAVVPEADEENNEIWYPSPILVGEERVVDLAVERVSFAPSEIAAGDRLRVAFTLRNLSAYRSAAFVSAVVLSADATVADDDRELGRIPTSYLDGGGTLLVDELLPIPVDIDGRVESWTIGVRVDPDDELIGEPDEANNVLAAEGSLRITGGQLGCQEDAFEPNDRARVAAQIGVGLHEGLGRCGNDDWYGLLVPAGESLFATLTSAPLQGDLDLELYAPDGLTLLDQSDSGAATETVSTLLVDTEGVYLIRVRGDAGVEAQYDLRLELTTPADGVDLQIDSLQVLPTAVLQGQELEVRFELLNFGIVEAAASTAGIFLSQDGVLDQSDLRLGGIAMPPVPGASRRAATGSFLPPLNLPGGTYLLFVLADEADEVVEVDETNNEAGSPPIELLVPVGCADDAFEPNNVCRGAMPLPSGSYESLVVCERFDDWFALDLTAGDCFSLRVAFDQQAGDIDLEVYRPGCQELEAVSRTDRDVESVQLCASVDGVYAARVTLFSGAAGFNRYRLDYSLQSCAADGLEPNDTPPDAPEISLAGESGLTTCGRDVDWYKLRLIAGHDVTLRAVVEEEGVPLTLTLYRPGAEGQEPQFLTSRIGQPLHYRPPTSGFYLLKVRQALDEITHYALVFEGLEGQDLWVSELTVEPAAVPAGGLLEVRGLLENARAEPLPPFSWGLYLSADERFDPAQDLLLGDGRLDAGLPPGGRYLVQDRYPLPQALPPGGRWVLFVGDVAAEIAEEEEANNLLAAPLEVLQLCRDDALEPNDRPAIATPLVAGSLGDLTICAGDVDWFGVSVPDEATRLLVRLTQVGAGGDLDLFVYGGPDGSQLLGRMTTAAEVQEVLLEPAPAGEQVLIKVQALGLDEGRYQLELGF